MNLKVNTPDSSCLPKSLAKIRLLLKNYEQAIWLIIRVFPVCHLRIPALITNILFKNKMKSVRHFRTFTMFTQFYCVSFTCTYVFSTEWVRVVIPTLHRSSCHQVSMELELLPQPRHIIHLYRFIHHNHRSVIKYTYIWAATNDFQQSGNLTSVDSDKPVQPPFKLRNPKWCSVSNLTVVQYSSDKQRLWSDCAYAQAGLSLCWSHIPHCWKSHVSAHIVVLEYIVHGTRVLMQVTRVPISSGNHGNPEKSLKRSMLGKIMEFEKTWIIMDKSWNCEIIWQNHQ